MFESVTMETKKALEEEAYNQLIAVYRYGRMAAGFMNDEKEKQAKLRTAKLLAMQLNRFKNARSF